MNIKAMTKNELTEIIDINKNSPSNELLNSALDIRKKYYGDKVYIRGLIEFTNYCKNNCYYCGLRSQNKNVHRYHLSKDEILQCCQIGYELGFSTYVLQGGEDLSYTDNDICDIVSTIKDKYPNCAITLSIGERTKDSYKEYKLAGADRYLLRHETATTQHYQKLHPSSMLLSTRKQCLYDLKDLGYQIGAGFMVGSPYQTSEYLAEDLLFLKVLEPHMVGIGPFIPQKDSKFASYEGGTLNATLTMLALTRHMLPKVLLPSTTALGTIDPNGREMGLKASANVVMPNLSPTSIRKDYAIYDNKICTGDEAAQCIVCLKRRIESAGFKPDMSRGDFIDLQK